MNHYLRVLYADDHEDTCEMVAMLLKFSGIEVTCAKTVEEAWQLAQTEYFDLYLLDVRFPDGDGLELCRRLREYAPRKTILFYSGNAYEADKQKGLAAGANNYLTKPYFGDLAETVLRAVELSEKTNDGQIVRRAQSEKVLNQSPFYY